MSETKDTQQHPKVEIAVENFGPIAKANIDLRPLTVFVGPSNTGKTYFTNLIYAMHWVFYSIRPPRFRSLPGPEVTHNFLDFLSLEMAGLSESQLSEDKEIQSVIEKLRKSERLFRLSDLPAKMHDSLRNYFANSHRFGIEFQKAVSGCFNLDSVLELRRLTDGQPNEMMVSLKVGEEHQGGWGIEMNTSETDVTLKSLFDEDMILVPEEVPITVDWGDEENLQFYLESFEIESKLYPNREGQFGSTLEEWLIGGGYECHYLPAARSSIMQNHLAIIGSRLTGSTQMDLEDFPDVPSLSGMTSRFIFEVLLRNRNRIQSDEIKKIAEALESNVLAGQIRVKSSSSRYPDYRFSPQGIDEEMRFSQVSSMISELAPLVLLLRSGITPSDTLIIEEPEAHLHPGAQADMAVILARLVRAGVRVIITTHSDWMLQEIGNLIRAGELEKAGEKVGDLPTSLQKEQVGVWHFQKDGKVEEIPYNRIDGVEPMEYLDVAEDLYNRSARLQNRLEESKGDSERE